jgi:hypothetical protein
MYSNTIFNLVAKNIYDHIQILCIEMLWRSDILGYPFESGITVPYGLLYKKGLSQMSQIAPFYFDTW